MLAGGAQPHFLRRRALSLPTSEALIQYSGTVALQKTCFSAQREFPDELAPKRLEEKGENLGSDQASYLPTGTSCFIFLSLFFHL